MEADMKADWLKGAEKATANSTLFREGYIKVIGRLITKMDLEFRPILKIKERI